MYIHVKSGVYDYSRTVLCFDRIIDTNSFSWFRFIGSIPRYSRRAFIPLSTSRRESLENLFTTSIAFAKSSSFYILKVGFISRGPTEKNFKMRLTKIDNCKRFLRFELFLQLFHRWAVRRNSSSHLTTDGNASSIESMLFYISRDHVTEWRNL